MQIARRNKLEIISSILSICRGDGASKTRIVYQANLNFKNAGIYLEWMTNRGYLIKESKIYKTTLSGQDLLDNLKDLSSMINGELEEGPGYTPGILHLSRV